MIHIQQYWMAVEPIDMRAGMETVLGKVVAVFGSARAHHAYLFTNRRANRLKVLVTDEFGVWLTVRRLVDRAASARGVLCPGSRCGRHAARIDPKPGGCAAGWVALAAPGKAKPDNGLVRVWSGLYRLKFAGIYT